MSSGVELCVVVRGSAKINHVTTLRGSQPSEISSHSFSMFEDRRELGVEVKKLYFFHAYTSSAKDGV